MPIRSTQPLRCWNGLTAWIVLIVHVFGAWSDFPFAAGRSIPGMPVAAVRGYFEAPSHGIPARRRRVGAKVPPDRADQICSRTGVR